MSMKCVFLKPHFHTLKLGYVGVYLFFLFLLQNIDCEYSLELPDNFAAFFNCTPVGRASMMTPLKAIHLSWLGPELLVCCLTHRGSVGDFLLLRR